MLDLVQHESERIDARFLEPACGDGNFLTEVLVRKLATVQSRFSHNEFERRHYALLALMCIYGIELLEDNVHACRDNLATIFVSFINDAGDEMWEKVARIVLANNIVQANALTMEQKDGAYIVFPEWAYLGKGRFQRRDFQYSELTQRSSISGTLFEELGEEEIFAPVSTYPPMTVSQIVESAN